MTALAKKTAEFIVPDEKAVRAIEGCANAIFNATTIADVKRVMSQAEAVAAWVKTTEASERVRRDAAHLLIRAERRLGEITATIPRAIPQGGGRPTANFVPAKNPNSRSSILSKHGLDEKRIRNAEKMAALPAPVFERTLAAIGDRATPTTFAQEMGWQAKVRAVPMGMRTLAEDAVKLLDECCKKGRAPRRDEVNKFELRLAAFNVESATQRQSDSQEKKDG